MILTRSNFLATVGMGLGLGKLATWWRRRDPVPVKIEGFSSKAVDKLSTDRIVIQIVDAQGRAIREIEHDLRELESRDAIQRRPRRRDRGA